MANQQFDKFINKKVKGAKKKELIKQEKKAEKKEREAFFIEKKRADRAAKKLQYDPRQTSRSTKPVSNDSEPRKGAKKDGSRIKPAKTSISGKKRDERFERPKKQLELRKERDLIPEKQTPAKHSEHTNKKPATPPDRKYPGKPLKQDSRPPRQSEQRPTGSTRQQPEQAKKITPKGASAKAMPLNKYIAHGGICSRRDAGEMVKKGLVTVNGKSQTDPGYKVQDGDTVVANGKKVTIQSNLVYLLLNKPKDFITTVDDPQGRKTVLDIVKNATQERIYPVGRLDRNTSGVLLLTNDGELAQQLTHPSFEVRKIYEARLNKPLAKTDFQKLIDGVTLEDGAVHADAVAYADSTDKSVIGIEIHSGRNRVVRRMFEHLGYDVKNLDRVMFANLTKKNVERGKYRFLTEKEVRLLKFFNKSKKPKQ